MTVKQTRCPFCHSAFYITSLQLNAYRGQARCGQCHQVFDATQNMVQTSGTATGVSAPEIVVIPVSSTRSTAPSQPAPANPAKSQPDADLLFSDEQGFFDADEPASTPSGNSNMPLINDAINEDFLTSDFEQIDRLKATELSQVERLHAAADESWVDELLNESAPATTQSNPQSNLSVVPSKHQPQPVVNKTSQAASSTPIDRGVYSKLPEAINRHDPNDEDEDLLSFLNRTGAVSMPLSSPNRTDLSTPKPASHRILNPTIRTVKTNYVLGWGLMCLLMAILLIGQYVYFNFEKLSLNPRTSLLLSRICGLTGCHIPYMNVDELHIKKLRIVPGSRPGETTFKAQLVNSASMSQPFPALNLTLKRNGKAVASQIIQPRQYLPEQLKTFTRLATNTPYPLSFSIKTKRSDFDGYSLEPQYR